MRSKKWKKPQGCGKYIESDEPKQPKSAERRDERWKGKSQRPSPKDKGSG